MVEELDDLQALWRAQRAESAPRLEPVAMTTALRHHAARERRASAVKIGAPSATVLMAVWWMVVSGGRSRTIGLGALWCIAAAASVALAEWRRSRTLSRLDFSAPSMAFIESSLAVLERHHAAGIRSARLLATAFIGGVNVMVFGMTQGSAAGTRIGLHLACTVLPLAAYAIGIRARRRRAAAAYTPLLAQLRTARDGMRAPDEGGPRGGPGDE